MQVDAGAERRGARPERVERRVIEVSTLPLRQRTDHHAAEAALERLAQHFGRPGAILQRNRRERRKTPLRAERFPHAIVDEPAPAQTFLRHKLIAEAIQPTADELMVDAVSIHPCAPIIQIGELRRDGTSRFGAQKLQPNALLAAKEAYARKLFDVRIEPLHEEPRHIVRVHIDDQGFHHAERLVLAASIASQSATGVIGKRSTLTCSGANASLIALAIAAGAPR